MPTLQDQRTVRSRRTGPLAAWLALALVIVPVSFASIVTSVDFVLAAVGSDSGVDAYVIGSLYALFGLVLAVDVGQRGVPDARRGDRA